MEADEERALVAAIREGDRQALEGLVRANLPFVLKVAREYRGRGVAFEDLVAEGNLGLLEAVPRFAPERGTRFVTYALWWIRKRMLSALEMQAHSIRVPGQFWKCRRKPGGQPRPIEVRWGGEDGVHPVERLCDSEARHAEKDLVYREALRRVRCAVERLSEQERRVLGHRFGLGGAVPLTLRETGEQLRISRERVRQVEQQAIARLKRVLLARYPRVDGPRLAPPPARPSAAVPAH